jgi:hypothetical protein
MNLYSHLDHFETGCLSCIQRGFGFTRNYIIPSILLLKMYTIYKLNEYTSLLLNVKDYDGIREELEEEQERLEEFKQSQSYSHSHSNEETEPSCPKWFLAMDAIPLTQIEIRSIQDEEQEEEQEEEEDDEDNSTISSSESEAQNEQESENQSVSQSDIDNEPHGEPPEENDENVSDSDETKSQNTSSEIVSKEEPEEEPENRPLEYPPENPITIDTMIPEHIPEGCLTTYQALLLAELNPRMYKVMVVFMDGQMKTFYGDERIERS